MASNAIIIVIAASHLTPLPTRPPISALAVQKNSVRQGSPRWTWSPTSFLLSALTWLTNSLYPNNFPCRQQHGQNLPCMQGTTRGKGHKPTLKNKARGTPWNNLFIRTTLRLSPSPDPAIHNLVVFLGRNV